MFNTAKHKATTAKGKPHAQQESYDGSIEQSISLRCAQLGDGAKDDDEA